MDIIQMTIQAGAVGVAVYLIYIGRKDRQDFTHILTNHLNNSVRILERLANKMEEGGHRNMEEHKKIVGLLDRHTLHDTLKNRRK